MLTDQGLSPKVFNVSQGQWKEFQSRITVSPCFGGYLFQSLANISGDNRTCSTQLLLQIVNVL